MAMSITKQVSLHGTMAIGNGTSFASAVFKTNAFREFSVDAAVDGAIGKPSMSFAFSFQLTEIGASRRGATFSVTFSIFRLGIQFRGLHRRTLELLV